MIEYCIGVRLSGGNMVPLCSLPMPKAWAEEQIVAMNSAYKTDRYMLMERFKEPWKVSDNQEK